MSLKEVMNAVNKQEANFQKESASGWFIRLCVPPEDVNVTDFKTHFVSVGKHSSSYSQRLQMECLLVCLLDESNQMWGTHVLIRHTVNLNSVHDTLSP